MVDQMRDSSKRSLIGSESRDQFKREHKNHGRDLYASDADLVLISKTPPGVVAYLDYKIALDSVTFAETILYNEWMATRPVYVIVGQNPVDGPFDVYRYEGGDWRPDPPQYDSRLVLHCATYADLAEWERKLRGYYQRCNGHLVSDEEVF